MSAADVAGAWWAQAIGGLTALASLTAALRRWPRIGRWFWGVMTANVRAARAERERDDLLETNDRLYGEIDRLRNLIGGGSGGSPASGPGSGA